MVVDSGKLQQIATHYKYAKQSHKAIEEMAELTQAICKYEAEINPGLRIETKSHVLEEIADVTIMMEQLCFLLGGEVKVSEIIEQKLDRQLERIRKEGEAE